MMRNVSHKTKHLKENNFLMNFSIQPITKLCLRKGPPRLPFFGSYLFLLILNYKHFQFAVDWLCKYYKTNILGLYIGPFPTVVANDSASNKELMLNAKMDGRPDLLLSQLRDPSLTTRGITSLWLLCKRFLTTKSREPFLQESFSLKACIGEISDGLR